jgi:hypothetical protein
VKKRTYQFQLRLGVHRVKPFQPEESESRQLRPLFVLRDVLQQPLDFSTSQPDVTYHLKPRNSKNP